MRTVSIRDFQRNFYKEILDLPLTVTKIGNPFIVVTSCVGEEKVISKMEKFRELKNLIENKSEIIEDKPVETPKKYGRCKVPGCLLEASGLGKHWEDGGFFDVQMCEKHVLRSFKEYETIR